MINGFTGLVHRLLGVPVDRSRRALHIAGVAVAAASFTLIATVLVAYDNIFLDGSSLAGLRLGDTASADIRAPVTIPYYISQVLTEQQRAEVSASVSPVFNRPDPAISRRQSDLASQILTYIENLRQDSYATTEQKRDDVAQISDLTLDDAVSERLLTADAATWGDIREQITTVLERVMRGEIREGQVDSVKAQLPLQVSVQFSEEEVGVIVAVIEDLIRPNTLLNQQATEEARQAAIADISVRRSFERGQLVVRAGERIDEAAYEALGQLGLLQPNDRRFQEIARAALASILVLIIMGLYVARFRSSLFKSSRFMALLAGIFLIILLGARITGLYGQIYLYPTAALALLYVALVGPEIAVVGTLGMAALISIMQVNSLEMALLVGAGGMMASLTLRRPERLNGYFMPGLLVAVTNVAVIAIFFQGSSLVGEDAAFAELVLYSLINGILSGAVALGGMFVVTTLFNLPTGLKLVELSQPSQPLLQRVLREAPGTYQHSLQVANLAEQAANAIGLNADLVRVAAMYHDIGKVENAAFFTENQPEGVNPHDALNDPYRSADIIISHVTDGEKMARQYRLPARIRDFILEHHGTQVLYFYDQAVARAGDDEVVDVEQFTYPGPKPQSRETAVLMLADSCEAAVRSRKPTKKQEIADTIQQIIDSKIRTGQLDESGLTLNDIRVIRRVFGDMLQAVFHPRISYPVNTPKSLKEVTPEPGRLLPRVDQATLPEGYKTVTNAEASASAETITAELQRGHLQTREIAPVVVADAEENDDAPLPEVPRLPRTGETRTARLTSENGTQPPKGDAPEEQ
ncbi:MAG: HDIG domain-containing protein [Anaerolineae bacterium]|nr:HDIG domain-containing protein [Anaerolineae bacterium]